MSDKPEGTLRPETLAAIKALTPDTKGAELSAIVKHDNGCAFYAGAMCDCDAPITKQETIRVVAALLELADSNRALAASNLELAAARREATRSKRKISFQRDINRDITSATETMQ